jgi:hypothetical protein
MNDVESDKTARWDRSNIVNTKKTFRSIRFIFSATGKGNVTRVAVQTIFPHASIEVNRTNGKVKQFFCFGLMVKQKFLTTEDHGWNQKKTSEVVCDVIVIASNQW